MLTFLYAKGHDIRYFSHLLPLLVAAYFVIAGNIFAHRLGLNRWLLWLIMNVGGGRYVQLDSSDCLLPYDFV